MLRLMSAHAGRNVLFNRAMLYNFRFDAGLIHTSSLEVGTLFHATLTLIQCVITGNHGIRLFFKNSMYTFIGLEFNGISSNLSESISSFNSFYFYYLITINFRIHTRMPRLHQYVHLD